MSSDRTTGANGNGPTARPRGIRLSLGTARIVSALMYVGELAPFIIFHKQAQGVLDLAVAPLVGSPAGVNFPLLGWAMLGVGVAGYAVSLFMEGLLLSEGWGRTAEGITPQTAESRVGVAAIIISAFGASLAVYGLVLTWLSFPTFAWYLYGLCAIHGIHLHLRWDRYEEAVRRFKGNPA
ncbi:MAG TPA: hypothetical protein VM221_06185 [Armatimonadota bacterium]|nr:hypothetical protein [Armatimonadota bacterium]